MNIKIFKKRDKKSKLSLDRIRILLSFMDNPQNKLKFIHIAGTNGKGSVTTTMANLMQECGYKTGKYISPYVDNFYERIQVNGKYITDAEVKKLIKHIKPFLKQMRTKPTVFEIITAIAFKFFYDNNCDIVCLETGLGGRFDATNIINTTLISIITLIDYDHMDYLGNTLEEITFEKCGIIKENKITLSYPLQKEKSQAIIETFARIRNNRLVKINLKNLSNIEKERFNFKFKYKNKNYTLGLNGKHQIYNALLCIEAANQLNMLGFKINYKNVYNAIKNTKFIGRLEIANKNILTILDGAHNAAGAVALKDFLKSNRQYKITLLIAMIKNKDHEAFLKEIAYFADNIIITTLKDNIKRSAKPELLKELAQKHSNANIEIIHSQKKAYEKAKHICGEHGMIIATGSLYFISEFRSLLSNSN